MVPAHATPMGPSGLPKGCPSGRVLELKTRVRSLLRVRHLTNERDRLLAYLQDVERSAPQPTAGKPE